MPIQAVCLTFFGMFALVADLTLRRHIPTEKVISVSISTLIVASALWVLMYIFRGVRPETNRIWRGTLGAFLVGTGMFLASFGGSYYHFKRAREISESQRQPCQVTIFDIGPGSYTVAAVLDARRGVVVLAQHSDDRDTPEYLVVEGAPENMRREGVCFLVSHHFLEEPAASSRGVNIPPLSIH